MKYKFLKYLLELLYSPHFSMEMKLSFAQTTIRDISKVFTVNIFMGIIMAMVKMTHPTVAEILLDAVRNQHDVPSTRYAQQKGV